jgi:protein-S-isoprenylcysteine O-methyltransferase Ste14
MSRSFMMAFPLAGLMLLLVIGVLWRGWFQYRRYGNLGIVLFQSRGSLRDTRDTIFCLLFVAAVVQAAVFFVSPESLARFEAVSLPAWAMWLGGSLTIFGLTITVAAQLGMGASWRIGIDRAASPGLVTSGLYQFCRNPIYLGMIVMLTGITLMLATWISLALAAGVVWSIRTQVMEEELYLERTYGSAFRHYAARVGRFWPRVGRLNRALSLG